MENYSDADQQKVSSADLPSLLHALTVDGLRGILQGSGYRVELAADEAGRPQLRSASSGLPYFVRFGNATGGPDAFVDVTFYSALRIEGGPSPELPDEWNASRRFARLHRSGDLLILQMDVSVIGGATREHLIAFVDIWDRLLNDLLRVVRDRLSLPPAG